MDVTSLANLLSNSARVSCLGDGLRLVAESKWIVNGETRLSYTTLIRLIECCREYHWQQDVQWQLSNTNIDTTCKSMQGQFLRPVEAGQSIDIIYCVREVRNRGYRIQFSVLDTDHLIKYAEMELVMVFHDPLKHEAVAPPSEVLHQLRKLMDE